MNDLKPCPFDGYSVKFFIKYDLFGDASYEIVCTEPSCLVSIGNFQKKEWAIEAWNKRAHEEI